MPEGWGLDSVPVLAEIALRTARIHLISGVLSVWGRTPATLAMSAATLHQISGGRYALGLGTSTKALAEGFHDVPFEHPAAKLRDAAAPHARPLTVATGPITAADENAGAARDMTAAACTKPFTLSSAAQLRTPYPGAAI